MTLEGDSEVKRFDEIVKRESQRRMELTERIRVIEEQNRSLREQDSKEV